MSIGGDIAVQAELAELQRKAADGDVEAEMEAYTQEKIMEKD